MPSLDLGSVVGPQGEQGATGAQGIRGEQGLPGPNQVTNSTATPLTGILTGNGSVVGVRAIDDAPTADSTGIPISGGVKAALDGKAPVYGLGKNLLDNWYFLGGGSHQEDGKFPINQRGITSYGGGRYTIDRWYSRNAGIVSVTPDSDTYGSGLKLEATSTALCIIRQLIPLDVGMLGKELTFTPYIIYKTDSTLFRIGLASSLSSTDWQYSTSNTTLNNGESLRYSIPATKPSGFDYVYAEISVPAGNYALLGAVKLELGSVQTLYHNEGTDASPVWGLNEVPNFAKELAHCQKYFFAFNAEGATYGTVGPAVAFSATQADCFMTLPSYMRKTLNSSLSYSGSWQLTDGIDSGQRLAISSMNVVSSQFWTGSSIVISVTSSGMTPGKTYYLRTANDSTARMYISADL